MSIRINQRLDTRYNPDGTPGTVSTGAPGAPGPAPTAEQIAAAVSAYIDAHPVTVPAVSAQTAENTRFGSGAAGKPGTYVDVGSHGSLQGYVTAGGTPATVNLYLQAKNGVVVLDGAAQVSGTLDVLDNVALHDQVVYLRGQGDAGFTLSYTPAGGTTLVGTTISLTGPVAASSSLTVAGLVSLATPVVGTDTALTGADLEIKAATIRKTAGNRRGFVLSDLPSDLVVNGQVDVLGVLATLWAQVKTLTP